jgi:hypothetical protein
MAERLALGHGAGDGGEMVPKCTDGRICDEKLRGLGEGATGLGLLMTGRMTRFSIFDSFFFRSVHFFVDSFLSEYTHPWAKIRT